jgi:hypothetical protein
VAHILYFGSGADYGDTDQTSGDEVGDVTHLHPMIDQDRRAPVTTA